MFGLSSLVGGLAPDATVLVLMRVAQGAGAAAMFPQALTGIGHVTNAVPPRNAPDISGVTTTTLQIGGALGVAGFGSVYLTLFSAAGPAQASHAFALTSLALGGTALLAAVAAYLATHVRNVVPA